MSSVAIGNYGIGVFSVQPGTMQHAAVLNEPTDMSVITARLLNIINKLTFI